MLGTAASGLAATSPAAQAQTAAPQCATAAIPYGAAIRVAMLDEDPGYRRAVIEHCKIVVSEGHTKWIDLRPEPGKFTFERSDKLLAFADENGMSMRGHTLVWYAAMPKWTEAIKTAGEAERALYGHIDTVLAHYKGKIRSWDVVNEAISDDPIVEQAMRKSLWQGLLGTRHIEMALRRSAAADPDAQLVLNEFGFENPTPQCRAKRAAFLRLVKDLKDRDVPLHAIGLQGHLPGQHEIDKDGMSKFVAELHGMGLSILVTELDVIDDKLPGDRAIRDEIVAERTQSFLQSIGDVCRPEAVVTWGITDQATWVPIWFKRKDGQPNRPLPLDASYRPKPMMRVIREFTRARA